MKRAFLIFCFLQVVCLAACEAGSITGAPSWYFTVPKAATIERTSFVIGLPYIDYSPAERLEVGLHGIKYVFSNSSSYPVAVGVDPILSFAYAYAVWGLPVRDGSDLTVGVKLFPLFLLLGYETQVDERVSFVIEANDGAMAGFRVKIDPNWHVELGAGVTTYGRWRADPFQHRGISDYHMDDIDFEPSIWVGFAYSDFVGKYTE
ncbi:MAG: hypothetical protein V2A71_04390 [Candidatus Eisenbacteria bacterium]